MLFVLRNKEEEGKDESSLLKSFWMISITNH
jgi:hypothetical protein